MIVSASATSLRFAKLHQQINDEHTLSIQSTSNHNCHNHHHKTHLDLTYLALVYEFGNMSEGHNNNNNDNNDTSPPFRDVRHLCSRLQINDDDTTALLNEAITLSNLRNHYAILVGGCLSEVSKEAQAKIAVIAKYIRVTGLDHRNIIICDAIKFYHEDICFHKRTSHLPLDYSEDPPEYLGKKFYTIKIHLTVTHNVSLTVCDWCFKLCSFLTCIFAVFC